MAEMKDYKLPVKSVESTKNFAPQKKKQWYTLDELRQGDYAGMTETDSVTSGKEDGQYTPINKKSGKAIQTGGKSLGFEVKYDKHTQVG